MDWRKWFGLDNGVVDENGIPLCGCGHAKNYHITGCFIQTPYCRCTKFIQARK